MPELRAIAQAEIDAVTMTYAQLNGSPVEIFRTKSPTFSYTLSPENDIYSYFGCGDARYAGGVQPAVADGYWAYIPPLAPGVYTLTFGGTKVGGFALNVTYFLTIE